MRRPVPAIVLASAMALPAIGSAAPPMEPAPRDIVPVAELSAHAPFAMIAAQDLHVTLALPDARYGFYRSTRFDWSGMITAATRAGAHFYGPWFDGMAPNIHDFVDTDAGVVVGPRNAATGPAEEFANRDGETVLGYNAAPPGGSFIKIGVGRLQKPDAAAYDHFRAYAIIDGGSWTIQRGKDRIVFLQHLVPDAGGYGYDYEKTISLAPGGVMTIGHRLRNIGTRPIATQVYTHNFARFDDAQIGPGVSVGFPFAVTGAVSNPALASLDGTILRYRRPLAPGDRLLLPAQQGNPAAPPGAFRVTGANGAAITMQADVPLVRTVLWSMRRTVAVEPFVAIKLPPGAEQRWSWRYVFTAPTGAR